MTTYQIDPRRWAILHPRTTACIVAAITLLMAWGNYAVPKRGLLDDIILPDGNIYKEADRYVREKIADGFAPGEIEPFVLEYPRGIQTPADLQRIRDLTERVKQMGNAGVLSLSETPAYHDNGETLSADPYIPAVVPADFDIAAWKRRVADDPSVAGVFVGRDFTWATVVRYIAAGYNDTYEFRRIAELLEARPIAPWEWLVKGDVNAPPDVGVAGSVMTRGFLDQGAWIDTMLLVSIGVGLAVPIFLGCLGSVREVVIAVAGMVGLSFFWCRGVIGVLSAFDLPIGERPTSLLAYSNCIVQSISFVLHKLEALHEVEAGCHPPAALTDRWLATLESDWLIASTGVISVFGFATLYTFEVMPVRELGIVSAIAVALQLVLVTTWIPAIHILTDRGVALRPQLTGNGVSTRFRRGLDWCVAQTAGLVTWASPRWVATVAGGGTLLISLLAAGLVWPGGYLAVNLRPLDWFPGTIVARTGAFMNQPGRLGYDFIEFLVEPATPTAAGVNDPAFLAQAVAYQDEIAARPDLRQAVSVLQQLRHLSRESLHKPLPETSQEARTLFALLESDLPRAVARALFYANGVGMTVSLTGDDSNASATTVDELLRRAREGFPGLRVSPFGKRVQAPLLERYVEEGKPKNLFSSELLVIVLCAIGIALRNRRHRGRVQLRPWVGGMVMSLPFVFATAVMVLMMIALGIPLDPATACITAIAINASVDFAIYYADAYLDGLARTGSHHDALYVATAGKGRLVLEDMLLNAVCFAPLLLSRFTPLRDIGGIMLVMLPACAFGTVVLMPALFGVCLRATVPAAGVVTEPETHLQAEAS